MKTNKLTKALSLFLALILLVSSFPGTLAVAAEEAQTFVTVQNAYTQPDKTVDVDITIENNPGLLGAILSIKFDTTKLELIGAKNGEAFSALSFTKPGRFNSPCQFAWDAQDIEAKDIKDGTILTLTFKVKDTTEAGQALDITASTTYGDFVDTDLNAVRIGTTSGVIDVLDYTPGDVNNDGRINSLDIIYVRRHIVGGYDVDINLKAANVNGDTNINMTDVIYLRRYIAGGYGIELVPPPVTCVHDFDAIEAKEATCTENGNKAYWYCKVCEKYFEDEGGVKEIALADTVIEKVEHTVVKDEYVAPTYDSTGLTEGSHCSVCGTVIVAQTEIPKLQKTEYAINYKLGWKHTYIDTVDVGIPEEMHKYAKEDGLELPIPEVYGFNFEGWSYGQSDSSEKITTIPAGETGNKTLYAHWTKQDFEVTFDSPLVPVANKARTIDSTTTLENLNWDGYIFMGWSDASGKIVDSVKPGTGDITLYANWTSQRNQTRPHNYLETGPVIIEESEIGKYYFVYDIGEIVNVPLYTLKTFHNKTAGMTFTEQYTKSGSLTQSLAKSVNSTLANTTIKSASWTLSNDWNELITETEDTSYVKGSEYTVSISDGSSNAHTESGSENNGTSKETASKDGTTSKTISKESMDIDVGVSGGVKTPVYETTVEFNMGTSSEDTEEEGSSSESSQSDGSTWNKETSSSDTNSSYHDETRAKSIAETASKAFGHSTSKSTGGSDSATEVSSSEEQTSKGYSSSFSYSSVTAEETTETWTNENSAAGYYRLVCAGKIHVYAVVEYDIATRTYMVHTCNVLDDETSEFTDYSKNDPDFGDYNNGVLPFEVPVSINEYVSKALKCSSGLFIDRETGIIDEYSGTAKNVYIPDYMSLDNNDGTYTVVKVNGIDSNVFAGKDIKSIRLGQYITNIPNEAFKGCSNLETIKYTKLTSIGKEAFSGCSSLSEFTVENTVTELGNNAFDGVSNVVVNAANERVALAAVTNVCSSLKLDIGSISQTLKDTEFIVKAIDYFEINGKANIYNNLSIDSNAKNTVINRATFSNNKTTPLKIKSKQVTLNQVIVENSPNIALVLLDDNTNVYLQGKTNLSTIGNNVILCKNIILNRLSGVTESVKLSVSGNVLVCGEIANTNYISVSNGEIKDISETEFNSLLSSYYVYFDVNDGEFEDGTTETKNILVENGYELGTLPAPTRDYYAFLGWFTQDDTKVTPETKMGTENITLIAKWELNPLSDPVLETKVPEGAKIEEGTEEWRYKLTTKKETKNSSESGYTMESWRWSDYGGWSDWSYTAAYKSDSRDVKTQKVITGYNKKTQYNYSKYVSDSGWTGPTQGTWGGVYCYIYKERGWSDSAITNVDWSQGFGIYNDGQVWYNEWTRQVDNYNSPIYSTQYSYRDRHKLYTHTKTVSKTSKTAVTAGGDAWNGGQISNIKKYVQYRAK